MKTLAAVTITVLFAACVYAYLLFDENKTMEHELQTQGKKVTKLERDRNGTWALLGIKQLDNGCENLYIPAKK